MATIELLIIMRNCCGNVNYKWQTDWHY